MTDEILGRAQHINNSNWIAEGLDWEGNPGILLGHQRTWDLLSLDEAEQAAIKILIMVRQIRENYARSK